MPGPPRSTMTDRRNLPALMTNLENFLEVARIGSVSRAAAELFMSQPALTARLHALEAELGQQLFLRTRRGVRLTEAGIAFLPYAERAVRAAAEGLRAVEEAGVGAAGSLIVGATPSISATVLPAALRRVRTAFPATRLSVRTGHSEQIVELVLREEVRVGVVRDLSHPEIERQHLFDDELVFVVASAHRFAKLEAIQFAALRDEQLVLFDRTTSYHELTGGLFRGGGASPDSIIELDNIDAARRMVQEGFGVALLPLSSVANDLHEGSLVRVPIADATTIRRTYIAIRRRDSRPANEREVLFVSALRDLGASSTYRGGARDRAPKPRGAPGVRARAKRT